MRFLPVLLLLLATSAYAGDGVQITPDGSQILVSKDVGNERWSITLDLTSDNPLHVSGNVFRQNGGPPAFLHCSIEDVIGDPNDIRRAQFIWNCFAADRCDAAPCTAAQWTFIAQIKLPGEFFLP
jgi:hypothetical protein